MRCARTIRLVYLPQINTRLEVTLTGGTRKKTPLAQFLVTLCQEPLALAELAIKVRGTRWAS
jgi:hypothetical protein